MRRVSRLLIDEPPLQVLPSLAVAIGLNEAMIVQQVHYWLLTSRHDHDGRTWIYNTVDEWQEQFPFWSKRTIERALAALEKAGYLLVGHYGEAWDRTKWYTLDYDALAALGVDTIPSKRRNGARHNGTMEPAVAAESSNHTETTTEEDDQTFARLEGGGITAARRAELVRAHTRGGVLDREGYRQAVAAVLRR